MISADIGLIIYFACHINGWVCCLMSMHGNFSIELQWRKLLSITHPRYGGADDEEGHIVNTHRLATNLQSDRMIGDDYGLLWLE